MGFQLLGVKLGEFDLCVVHPGRTVQVRNEK